MYHSRYLITLVLVFACTITFSQNAQQLFQEGKSLRADGKDRKAVKKYEEALEAAKAEKNLQVEMNAHMELAELKDNVVNFKEALSHYKEFSVLYKKQANQKALMLTKKAKVLTDSVTGLQNEVEASNTEIIKKNADIKKKESAIDSLTTEHLKSQLAVKDLELTNKAKELELQTSQNRWNILLFIFAIIVLATVFIIRGYFVKRKSLRLLEQLHQQIVVEKRKSDDLLLNILPESIAGELKEYGKTTPCRFDSATVMFTDFKGFTHYSEKHTPEELVKLVDHYFSAFDQIVKKHNIEKIKTIGDAYMCVSGIPITKEHHAATMIRAAFEFREFVNNEIERRQRTNEPFLRMRIGLHSGPLVAGVVGSRKFAYDVWGDTVNIAARMEQSGETDGINVSESVYEQVKNEFDFVYRGEVEAKNKGRMKMYFVTGEKYAGN
ncbi:MAG TPA: adenylate/guanylate cyclase domain-containing protein [Flavobacteriales bacterium]|nr:adenylate/guanylate cyclase domain-containing protein [Flavobacteriales bacterium]